MSTREHDRFYHASYQPLVEGTILEPRFFNPSFKFQYDAVASALQEGLPTLKALLIADYYQNIGNPNLPIVLKETVLEQVRVSEFPSCRSRREAIFLCRDKETALRFQQDLTIPYLYVCTVSDANVFDADMTFVRSANPLAPINEQMEYLIDNARRYWRGDHDDNSYIEVLVQPGTVTVVAPVT